MSEQSIIDAAVKAAQRLEEANKVTAELVRRQEQLEQSRLLGGEAMAGQKQPELTQEDKDLMDTKEYFKGTAIEKAFQ